MSYRDHNRWPRRGIARWLASGLLLLAVDVPLAEEGGRVESLEALVEQWSALRRTIAQEERDWEAQRRRWEDEIALLKKEKAELSAEIEEARLTGRGIEEESERVLREKERLAALLEEMPPVLEEAEAALTLWPDLLPPPLYEKLAPAFRRLRDVDKAPSRSARLQHVLGLYTEIEKLHRDIHVVKELLRMPDGKRREVDALYLGLSRAFAVSQDATWAGVGTPTGEEGWRWEARPELAGEVRNAIRVFRRERTAELVELPLLVQEVELDQ